MRTRMLVGVLAAIATTWTLTACGSSTKSAAPRLSVVGHTYTSTAVTGRTLSPGTHVTLTFGTDGKLSANAGCNPMSANYLIDKGRLVAGQMAITEMGCIPVARQAQDAWLARVLSGRPEIVQTGTTLRVTGGATTIDLAEA